MILPLLLWLVIILVVISIEFLISFIWINSDSTFVTVVNLFPSSNYIQTEIEFHNSGSIWLIIISGFFLGILIGWISELKILFLNKLNLYWQKTQPVFYQKFYPDFRELLPWFLVSVIIIPIALLFLLLLNNLFLSFFFIGITIGLSIEPIRRHRNMILMDRPEKPTKAVIHKVIPAFPLKTSLWIGDLYIRVLLPLFFCCIAIFFPSFLNLTSYIVSTNYYLIIITLTSGLIYGWYNSAKNNIYVEKIDRSIILNHTGKLLLTSSLIIFGLFSGNIFTICLIGFMGGWLLSPIR